MMETSQSLIRIAALFVFTALFAGLWANDRPSAGLTGQGILSTRHDEPAGLDDVDLPWSIEREGLTISPATLEEHLAQLPDEMSPGAYRIIDPRGGVGWLRIPAGREEGEAATELVTTISREGPVRFVRIHDTEQIVQSRTASDRR